MTSESEMKVLHKFLNWFETLSQQEMEDLMIVIGRTMIKR